MNFFAYPTVAERYAKGRPFFHPLAIEKIRAAYCPDGRTDLALDVGCGTGFSTHALLEIADKIIGLDSSAGMLSHAVAHERIRYVEAGAETLPFDDATFTLVTVALAFHWFDQPTFLVEAHRVLRPFGWLVVYDDRFTGQMMGNDQYQRWHREEYLARFPSPIRNNHAPSEGDATAFGFATSGTEQFVHEVQFTPSQLVSYLLTQSNAIAAVERGTESLQTVGEWILHSVRPLFSKPVETFPFSCQMRFFDRK